MVLVFNLDEDACDNVTENANVVDDKHPSCLDDATLKAAWTRQVTLEVRSTKQRSNIANVGSFSAALACYPIVSQIAQDLDLNTLDNLARTCSLFQALLRRHRKALIALSLRCSNDKRVRHHVLTGETAHNKENELDDFQPKRSPCATDLVGECRKCGILICRNCTAKPLVVARSARRHRRLCNVCIRAPISALMTPHVDLTRSLFTYSAFARDPCSCRMFFWLCQTCGQYLAHHDNEYHRIWTWRIRYSTYLGGLGTGIGEGYEGVKCGRGEDCLASRKFELEEDCSSDSTMGTPREGSSRPTSQNGATETPELDPDRAGYFRQEVEGIGGLMRGKMKKMVIVGQTVQEHEDEREHGDYLGREAHGISRSWCSWCDRVILSLRDEKEIIFTEDV